ncbi:hypothetical protein SAMN05660489_06375 [Pseudomonas sp. LAMO17WK12:I10]|nr:hypothetical protein H160_06393 [Pseudomonas sp. LAMO17WK12:I9]SNY54117.1 hypothetical protein SAMN05660489_06375 [Pseudomonas sp. LAMO17WK12:I10]
MATIRTRKKADGTLSYLVQIRINRDKVTVYQESQTFARKQAAQAWAKRRETELAEPGAIEWASRVGHTVKQMIDRYLVEAEKARPLGETKRRTLNAIKNSYLGEKVDSDISQQVLVDYALWRMSPEGGSVKPQTAGNDMAHLGSVLSLARAAWRYEIDPQAMPDARLVLKKFGYNMKSRERDCRVRHGRLCRACRESARRSFHTTLIRSAPLGLGHARFLGLRIYTSMICDMKVSADCLKWSGISRA